MAGRTLNVAFVAKTPTMVMLLVGTVALASGAFLTGAGNPVRPLLGVLDQLPTGVSITPAKAAIVATVLFVAGLVSGLSGFAFSAVAACVLWLLPPLQAVPLIMMLSAANQLLSISTLRKEMVLRGSTEREGALPYILGGLAGVPLGLALLRELPTTLFAAALGAFLVLYSLFVLIRPDSFRIAAGGSKTALAVGAAGGIIGGFSAFPGSIPVVYLGLRGAGKTETRGITQPYILALQTVSLTLLAVTDHAVFDKQFWLLFTLTLPAALLGSSAGIALYRHMSDVNFRRAVLLLLIVSGAGLLTRTML